MSSKVRRTKILLSIIISFFITVFANRFLFASNSPNIDYEKIIALFSPKLSLTPIVKETNILPTESIIPPTDVPSVTKINPPYGKRAIPTLKSKEIILPPTISSNNYQSLAVLSSTTDRPAENHPDINIHVRGYEKIDGIYDLIDVPGPTDEKAPQLNTLFRGITAPKITGLYQAYDWNWKTDSRSDLLSNEAATLVGFTVSNGNGVQLPISQYDIEAGYQALVLYATNQDLTLKYGREDHVVNGYVIYLEGLYVDPNLLSLYNRLNSEGRSSLPAVKGGEILGTSSGKEIKVAIRDTGSFMDPRVRKDWWVGN